MNNILVGCDPEVFVKQNGKFVSAFNMIPGTKDNPFKVESGAVQVDGMALEFNINPAKTRKEFLDNVLKVYHQLKDMVPNYEVVATPVAEFGFEYMKQQPEEALVLGCDPDFNAYTGEENPIPDGQRPFRTASGHVHIGWTDKADTQSQEHRQSCHTAIKQLDFFLGLPSLFYDDDVKRRELYGKAGACRYKPYGVEYRTLSNRWLTSPKLIEWVFEATQNAFAALKLGYQPYRKYKNVAEIINTSDLKAAEKILNQENILVPQV